jgi:hypothetical protein
MLHKTYIASLVHTQCFQKVAVHLVTVRRFGYQYDARGHHFQHLLKVHSDFSERRSEESV